MEGAPQCNARRRLEFAILVYFCQLDKREKEIKKERHHIKSIMEVFI
jgi:hypothetical protein